MITEQLPKLIGDAFDRAESTAFVSGTGSGQPQGIVTAISATIASTVTATTRSAFTSASAADIFKLDNAVTPRAREGRIAWLANHATWNVVRQMSPSAAGSSFWATLADGRPPELLGYPVFDASPMTSVTTTGSVLIVEGDMQQYLIVDRVGTAIEVVQNVVDGNGVPTGTRGFIGWKRTGAGLANVDAFRFLLL